LSEQLQLRSGTSTQVAAFIPATAECVVDTTNNRLVVGDTPGTTGGWPAAKLAEVTSGRTMVSDANYTVVTSSNWASDHLVAYTSITGARTVTLPAASAYPTGTELTVIDESGSVTALITITIAPHGSDNINGANSSVVINEAYGHITLESNGSNAWTIVGSVAPTATDTLAISPNGAMMQAHILEATATGLSGSSYNVSTQIPANCIVLGMSCRVTTAVTLSSSGTTFSIGDASSGGDSGYSTTRFGSCSLGAGSTNDGIIGPSGFYTNPTTIVLTPASGNTFTAGAVRLAIHYLSINPPAQ
jgi:hypothetical protein